MCRDIARPAAAAEAHNFPQALSRHPSCTPAVALDARPLFRQTRTSLLVLLAQLESSDWSAPTVAEPWRVRDLVAHLLGDDVGRLSRSRDKHLGPGPAVGERLPTFLARHNQEWVDVASRISPDVLVELLAATSESIHSFWAQEDLTRMGEPVSWVGPGAAPVWLDCARDLTEDWVHQQQIRLAVKHAGSDDPQTVWTVLDTFMYAMPLTLATHAVDSRDGDTLQIRIGNGDLRSWTWRRVDGRWQRTDLVHKPTACIDGDPATWWRLCVRMMEPEQARSLMRLTGEDRLAVPATQIISIIR